MRGLLLVLLITAGCENDPAAIQKLQNECQTKCGDATVAFDGLGRCACLMSAQQCINRCSPLQVTSFNPYANWGTGLCECGNVGQCGGKQ